MIGVLLAFLIWICGGLVSLVSLFLFFTLGTIASSWKKDQKSQLELEQENKGRRGIANVLGNGGTAGLFCILSFILNLEPDNLQIIIISSFSTACSDTFSSEFGNVYGKKYFNIINFQKAPRGMDGAVSAQGILFGLAGSMLIASTLLFFDGSIKHFIIVAISGILGNLFDSFLGATLQQKGFINNHQVNFLATLVGSIYGFLGILLFS